MNLNIFLLCSDQSNCFIFITNNNKIKRIFNILFLTIFFFYFFYSEISICLNYNNTADIIALPCLNINIYIILYEFKRLTFVAILFTAPVDERLRIKTYRP